MAEEFSTCVPIKEFIEKRAVQIADLLKVIDNSLLVPGEVTKGPRTAAQRLPRHMRRRAMAYEIRRFPKSLRNFANSYLNSNHRKKPPCRYYRRRSRNLLLNYIRRQRKCIWLETHIWHAKRFHMTDRYGYRLPDRSYQRNFRPIYRSSLRHCTIRDKSYLNCLIITGPSQELIIEKLNIFCCNDVSPTFAFKSGRSGRYEVSTLLFKPNSYPRGLIGPARFLWSELNGNYVLSLWIHPAMRKEFIPLITSQLSLIQVEKEEQPQTVKHPTSFEDWKIKSCQIDTNIYKSKDGLFTLEDLKDQLNRFRLYGPKSLEIIKNSIKLNNNHEYNESHEEWNKLSSSNELADSRVFSLLIEDPRISYKKEAKIQLNDATIDKIKDITPPSRFWNREERLTSLKNKLSDSEMNKLKEKLVSNLTETPAKIPIFVVFHNLGTGKRETLDGLEVIVPAGFGRDLWVSAQLNKAHASGIRDDLTAHLESGCLYFPNDYVETSCGKEEEKRQEAELLQKHLKQPHNRRVKFWRNNAIKYVYNFELQQLATEWSGSSVESYLLKDRRSLIELDGWLRKRTKRPDRVLNENKSALINVKLICSSRGKPKRFGIICLPTKEDLKKIRECEYNGKALIIREKQKDVRPKVEIKEAVKKPDNVWEDIVSLDLSAREKPISLKPLFPDSKNKDKAMKRKMQNKKKKEAKKRRVENQKKRLQELNEEEEEKKSVTYRDSSSRKIVGRVLRGDYSFSEAKGVAIGVIPLAAIDEVSMSGMLLFRNITSNYYHPVKVSVLKTVVEL